MILKGKIALITGGSSGIGAATATLFAQEGAKIAMSYRENKTGANAVASKINSDFLIVQADLTQGEDVTNLVEKVIDHFGRIDVLINNAGRYISGDEWNGDTDIWEKSLQQNLISVMNVSKQVIKIMQKQKSGIIINVASRHSVSGQSDALSYAAAKAGVVSITQAYAKLLAPFGRANAVSPGTVRAGYWLTASKKELDDNLATTPLGKLIEPEDIAETILFLASDKARMITGQNIIVDGGYTLK